MSKTTDDISLYAQLVFTKPFFESCRYTLLKDAYIKYYSYLDYAIRNYVENIYITDIFSKLDSDIQQYKLMIQMGYDSVKSIKESDICVFNEYFPNLDNLIVNNMEYLFFLEHFVKNLSVSNLDKVIQKLIEYTAVSTDVNLLEEYRKTTYLLDYCLKFK